MEEPEVRIKNPVPDHTLIGLLILLGINLLIYVVGYATVGFIDSPTKDNAHNTSALVIFIILAAAWFAGNIIGVLKLIGVSIFRK